LVEGDQYYERSDAALRIVRKLSGGWPLLYGFKIVPRVVRDEIYNLIGKNRYKFFGKKDACWIPTPELKSRFKD
jgi:predicted DCC family thiol-disulfide oxidoreductase YuxK